ncbi:cytochrome P450 [Aspergillus homomorphus CBS 101889]|uniref:Cytochrome P450 n=1 Tax=Aspergillus homomorphus (strain CBS 101889) TaxID=1450537 RepID=A0A395HKR6_ASPHC|nr:cytochrome P450 [Aspergillus homomorphus CBS 101889]RAL08542.1 cytochrome P450 [Aspergillus homomorphus CBS 101889]
MIPFLTDAVHLLLRFGGWSLFAGFVYISCICIYRLYFHPLAEYPGPLSGKLTTWRAVWHGRSGDLHVDIWRCHQKYGPIFRYAPHRVVFASNTGFHGMDILPNSVQQEPVLYSIPLIKEVYSTLNVFDKKVHGRKRRILSQGLCDQNLKLLEPPLLRVVDHLCDRLGEKQDNFSPANMAEWSDFYTFDVMTELVFGRSFYTLDSNSHHYILDGIMSQMRRMSLLTEEPMIERLQIGRFLHPGAMAKALRFSQAGRSIMEDRKRNLNPGAADICSKLLSAKDPETGDGFPFQELSGSDTTSTAMAAAFFYLSRYPTALNKATNEIRSGFTSIHDFRPGPFIPAGMEVGAGIYALQHNTEYFPDPFVFRPERWLQSKSKGGDGGGGVDQSAFAPFSTGSRSCVGKRLAIIEFTVVLARILWRFDLGLLRGVRQGEYHTDWCFTSKKYGPYIQYRGRKVVE